MHMDRFSRIIGSYEGSPGPLVVFLAGIHGNEPAGVAALRRVMEELALRRPPLRGRVLALAGNLPALAARRRFIHQDLNRMWSKARIEAAQARPLSERDSEERELAELFHLLRREQGRAGGECYLFDLHTTSGAGGIFSVVSSQPRHQELAAFLHVPVIYRLTSDLSATTNRFMDEWGWRGLGFEAGQHQDPASADRHESAAWLLLEKTGALLPEQIPRLETHHRRLIESRRRLPPYLEIVYRHAIGPEDEFFMHEGYENFSPVACGEPLGRDRRGEVLSPYDGYLLMPLYQRLGEEGFFIARQIPRPLLAG
jgi:succinylglutamate desuccinylase